MHCFNKSQQSKIIKQLSENMLNFLWIPACAGMTGSALCHSSESWNPVLFDRSNRKFKNIVETCLTLLDQINSLV
jgi:hypothetical protein